MSAALTARGLTVAFGPVVALEQVDLEVPRGVTLALLGPNGAGKSTLFAAAVGLVAARAGEVSLGAKRVAFVPQQLDLEPSFPVTVRDVVRMGRWGELGHFRRLRAADRRCCTQALEALGIAELADRRLGELSSGQRQRALLAQAVAQDAEVLLLDEPLTGVDQPTHALVTAMIARWRDEGRTVLAATHDLTSAAREFDLALHLNRRVIAFGPACEACAEELLARTFGARAGAPAEPAAHLEAV